MHTRVELSHLIRLRCLTLLSPFISSKSRLSRDVNKYIDDVYPTMKVIFFASTLLLIDSNQICYGFYARRIVKLVLGLSVRHWDMLHILWVTHQRPPKDRRGYRSLFRKEVFIYCITLVRRDDIEWFAWGGKARRSSSMGGWIPGGKRFSTSSLYASGVKPHFEPLWLAVVTAKHYTCWLCHRGGSLASHPRESTLSFRLTQALSGYGR